MSHLFDTHALIWEFLSPDQLSQPAADAFAQARDTGEILIADISLWEVAMLVEKGRIVIQIDCDQFLQALLQANNARVVPISPRIATLAVQLPASINKDPADRLILATAMAEKVPLVTADRNLRATSLIQTIW